MILERHLHFPRERSAIAACETPQPRHQLDRQAKAHSLAQVAIGTVPCHDIYSRLAYIFSAIRFLKKWLKIIET
jgi:hypothetical protein